MERIEGARTATHPPGLLLTYIEACGFAHRETVRETATTVTVRLSRHRFPGDPQCIDLAIWRTVRVSLRRPLGHRSLIDATTGRAVPVLDAGDLLRPVWVPAGFAPGQDSTMSVVEGGEPTAPEWSQQWVRHETSGTKACATTSISLIEGSGRRSHDEEGATTTTVTIHGARATVSRAPHGVGTVIRWHPRHGWSVEVANYKSCRGGSTLPVSTLLRVARSLR